MTICKKIKPVVSNLSNLDILTGGLTKKRFFRFKGRKNQSRVRHKACIITENHIAGDRSLAVQKLKIHIASLYPKISNCNLE